MKKKLKFGFKSQGYEAPRAESVDVAQESILCASPGGDENLNGLPQGFQNDAEGSWG